jgi:hypothetical protein
MDWISDNEGTGECVCGVKRRPSMPDLWSSIFTLVLCRSENKMKWNKADYWSVCPLLVGSEKYNHFRRGVRAWRVCRQFWILTNEWLSNIRDATNCLGQNNKIKCIFLFLSVCGCTTGFLKAFKTTVTFHTWCRLCNVVTHLTCP